MNKHEIELEINTLQLRIKALEQQLRSLQINEHKCLQCGSLGHDTANHLAAMYEFE